MSRRAAGLLVALATLVLAGAIYWISKGASAPDDGAPAAAGIAGAADPGGGPSPASPSAPAAPSSRSEIALESWTARLYFPAANDRLVPEERAVESGETPRERAEGALKALVGADPAAPRVPVFPAAVEVGRVLLLDDGTLVADLRSESAADPPASGSTIEQLRVYALVHTVLRNVPEASRVVLLWNGRQRASFAGHVDTARPLRMRTELEAPVPSGEERPPTAPEAPAEDAAPS